ncbi:MAG TPA: type II secretion system protein GspK [Anaerohalosphaeraceae bacterium]|nr:general secretion pathway protein GspK [Phycisphaerae bacterium]HOK94888.1 type II secretion system protein GspK [Anaerohalosphaeraceae bacterium]HOL31533.1 type II secretion system protein GspK [Anaerohalosphaeraceae bacterium]HOM75659.1 type II secretion system protein GspK [Anaerohalosphaeraceae bacterium]HPC64425.1 type II secretion system protein GspK [Anaerohalosphaeraceae bacterium]
MKRNRIQLNRRIKRPGTVLIITIWIVTMLASLIIVFSHYIRVEALAASNHIALVQAEAAASAAVQYIIAMLASQETTEVNWSSNPYEGVQVGEGYFWVLRPNLSEDRKYDFGLCAESGKININSASLETLLKLPSMTAELAASIIDWRDSNQELTAGGAENEYYLLLSNPYQCKNSPLETIEEVLLIKGATQQILYGEDTNRNGILDTNENDAEASPPSDNANGRLDPGFFHYVTIHSYESNKDKDGNTRINVNDGRSQSQLADLLRQAVGGDYTRYMNNIRQRRNYRSLIEVYFVSQMSYDSFNKIIDRLSTSNQEKASGLININTAPEEVLLCLPGLEQSDVDAMIKYRTSRSETEESILWITKVLSREKAEAIGSYITTRTLQYSADIVAASADGRAFRRYYVVIDTADGTPKVIYRQPLHTLGWPLDPAILLQLREGKGI